MGDKIIGVCNLCRQTKELTYEHVPPQAAFNGNKVVLTSADEYWTRGQNQGLRIRGDYLQRGHGVYTLCGKCNNDTGGWYGKAFVHWCRQGFDFFDKTKGKGSDLYFTNIRPLNILKQITTMFLALNGNSGFRDANQSLVRFVLNKDFQYLDPKYRFWVYYVAPGPLRMTPFGALCDIHTGQVQAGMEISFPPFGYMMTIDSTPDERLTEISGFARQYQYDEYDMVKLMLSVLPTHGPCMGDYRSFKPLEWKSRDETRYVVHFPGLGF